ncbi:MAG: hypothetical protein KF752_11870 [Pirellulaceae bacterium]|nr:hypothetical protein [Pirellulaceae bacterium]
MTFTIDMPETLGGSTMLDVAGKFHVVIRDVEENPLIGQNPFRGFCAEIEVIAPREHAEKTAKIKFGNPDLSHKDKGEFAKAKQASFAIATGVVDLSKLGQSVDADLSAAIGQHVLIEIEQVPWKDDPTKHSPNLRYANVFHVDDPRAKEYPRDDAVLKLVGVKRQPPEYFAPLMKKKQVTAAATATDDDFAGL